MIQDVLRQIISQAIQASFSQEISHFAVELPKNREHGDYATNAALLLTKIAKMPPRKIAEKICENIKSDYIESTEIAGPGFINFRLTQKAWSEGLKFILNPGQVKRKNKKILLEYISANPTGPLHLGHARGAFVGDVLARILKAAGYEVTQEFYVNDAGNQVKILGKSVYARYRELFGEQITLEPGQYPGEYIIDIAQKIKDRDGDKWLSKKDKEILEEAWLPIFRDFAIAENLRVIQEDLGRADICFDNFYSENALYKKDLVNKLISDYRNKSMLYEAKQASGTEENIRREDSNAAKYQDQMHGGTFLKTEQFGDAEDRILLRANGKPVYLSADLAYHQEKYDRSFDWLIDVFGADHGGHTPRIRAGMRALGLADDKLDFVMVQMVKLLKDGKEMKFSKRSGNIYLLRELLEEIGSDAARYIFLSRSPDSQFEFDLSAVLKESSENPVFYLQYGHARMANILRKADFKSSANLDLLKLPEEKAMIQKMNALPDVIQQAASALEPHRIIYYCQELIKEFHGYFTKYRNTEKIISDNQELTQARLALISALKVTIAQSLSLLGISAPDRMD